MLDDGSYGQVRKRICPYCRRIHGRANVCVPQYPDNLLRNASSRRFNWPSTYSVFSVCISGLEFIRFFI